MKNKRVASAAQALEGVREGATVLIGGFGEGGIPDLLLAALAEIGVRGLTLVANGTGGSGVANLIARGQVAKMICSFPLGKDSAVFREWYEAGRIELELVTQGTMAERMRAAGAGLGGFLTPAGVGTDVAAGKQIMTVDGCDYLLEKPLRGDVGLVRADRVDPRGNLTFRKAARNFNPVIATAAELVLVQANREVALGELDPEVIVTPGVYIDRYFVAASPGTGSAAQTGRIA